MKDSIFAFYTTARKARFSAYAGFAVLACCYIAVNSLLFHRTERDISYEVIWLLATMVVIAPIAYHFVRDASSNALTKPLNYLREHPIPPLKLLLAEDQETARVLRILLKQKGWEVLAEASDAKEVVEKVVTLRPGVVVLIDSDTAGTSGFKIAREITRTISDTKILMVRISYAVGGAAHVSFGGEIKVLDVAQESTVPAVISRRMAHLTTQQLQIFRLLVKQKSVEEMARVLNVDEDVVERDRTRIMQELDLASTGAVVLYRRPHKVSS